MTEQLVADLREANAAVLSDPDHFTPHCMIVEDDENDALLAKHAVEAVENVTADVIPSGDAAIQALRESKSGKRQPYQIVFLDLNLVGSMAQGYQVLQFIMREFPMIHVVIVSGSIDEGTLRFLAGDRYIGVIRKPLHETNLREILRKHQMDSPDFEV